MIHAPSPLGATLGDLLTKALPSGALALERISASLAIAAFMASCVMTLPQLAADAQNSGAADSIASDTLGKSTRLR